MEIIYIKLTASSLRLYLIKASNLHHNTNVNHKIVLLLHTCTWNLIFLHINFVSGTLCSSLQATFADELSKDNPLYNSIYNMVFKISHHCLVHANILSCAKTNSITLWLFKYSRTPINLGSIDVFFIENPKLLARQSRAHSLPHF